MQNNSEPRNEITERRSFLNYLLGAGLVGWLGTILYPILKYLKPEDVASADEVILSTGDKKKIEDEYYAIVQLGTERVIVFYDAKKKLHALSAKCTHEGCTVQYKGDEDIIWCACHNGKFNLDGQRISGPPPAPLRPYKVTGDLLGKVVVSRV